MHVDWTIHVVDLALAVLTLILIPVGRTLVTTLSTIAKRLEDLTYTIYGSEHDPSTGLVTMVGALKKLGERHTREMTEVRMELGLKVSDRS